MAADGAVRSAFYVMSANDDVYLIGSRHVAPLFYVLPWSAGTDRVESLCWKQTLHL